jgi:hypothetical protein
MLPEARGEKGGSKDRSLTSVASHHFVTSLDCVPAFSVVNILIYWLGA